MNIISKGKYPSCALSNFASHPFVLDGVRCASMEGFLQSLKFKNPEMQREVCKLIGIAAKNKGRDKKWYNKQLLYWQGVEYKRNSDEYQKLLNRAYNALNKNYQFHKALMETKGMTLTHSIGRKKKSETILTQQEFCSRLTKLRDNGTLD